MTYFFRVLLLIILIEVCGIYASIGDRSTFYQKCVHKCSFTNCSGDGDFRSNEVQPVHLEVMLWSCEDECRYTCMWATTDSFIERGWDIPQFHGKWPFLRICGVQEPASALFSLMNFVAHYVMLKRFRKEVHKESPMYRLWLVYSAVCLNAWFWSTIFHMRDFRFTERMDYFSAFSMVLYSFYVMMLRFFYGIRGSEYFSGALTLFCLAGFVHHVLYLHLVHFDYGYNMMANIAVGVANAVGWLGWSFWFRRRQPHVWRCILFVFLAGVSMLFELADFPPVSWVIDAHSLWHLGTVCLPFVFYRFVIDDCKYLRKELFLCEESIPMKVKSN